MGCPSKEIVRIWLSILIISITTVKVLGSPREKKFDIGIGFDLTQGKNGEPSIKIRDFEDSDELIRRAHYEVDNESKETKPRISTDSVSDSPEIVLNPLDIVTPESSKESSGKSEENEYSEEKLSTRGLKAAEYEPEENAEGIHSRHIVFEDDEPAKRRYLRRKRNVFFNEMRKNLFRRRGEMGVETN